MHQNVLQKATIETSYLQSCLVAKRFDDENLTTHAKKSALLQCQVYKNEYIITTFCNFNNQLYSSAKIALRFVRNGRETAALIHVKLLVVSMHFTEKD